MAPIGAGPALLRKIRSDVVGTWKSFYEKTRKNLEGFCELGLSTTDFQTAFGYPETQPYPSRVGWGERPDERPYRYRTYTAEQKRWMMKVEWFTYQERYSALGNIATHAGESGKHFGTLFERCFFQYALGSTDRQLMDALANAPDGLAMFSSATRFGMSGGNVVGSQLFSTGESIRAGLYAVIERAQTQTDPQGQPSVNDAIADGEITYIYPASRYYEVQQAFKGQFVAIDASTASSNAAVSNIVIDSGLKIHLWPTSRITTDTAFVIFHAIHGKGGTPLMSELVGMPMVERFYDGSNDKINGESGKAGMHYEYHMVPVLHLPRGAFQITT